MTTRIALLFLMCTSAFAADPGETLRPEQVVREMAAAINAREFERLNDLVAPDVRRHSGATPGVVVESLEQFKAFLEQDLASVPDAQQDLDFMFSCGNMVAARVFYRGHQSGPMGPFPPTGKALEIPFLTILRVEEGKIAEMWVEWDNLNALAQLGHVGSEGP
jgi:predicted ester cyclase